MKIWLGLLLCIVSSVLGAGEWGELKSGPLRNSVIISSPGMQANLIWPDEVVPGEVVLTSKTVDSKYEMTFYGLHRFVGVIGNSAQIETGVSTQAKGQSKSTAGETNTVYVERAADGAFYFVPNELKSEGKLKITRVAPDSGVYSLKLLKE